MYVCMMYVVCKEYHGTYYIQNGVLYSMYPGTSNEKSDCAPPALTNQPKEYILLFFILNLLTYTCTRMYVQ
jgi:hypothetical protein